MDILVSDYYAILELFDREATHGHHIADSKKSAAKIAIEAGVNMELPEPDCYNHLIELVSEGSIKESTIDELIRTLLYWKFKMGLLKIHTRNSKRYRLKNQESIWRYNQHKKR